MLPSNPKVKLVIHVRASLFCNIETTFELCGAWSLLSFTYNAKVLILYISPTLYIGLCCMIWCLIIYLTEMLAIHYFQHNFYDWLKFIWTSLHTLYDLLTFIWTSLRFEWIPPIKLIWFNVIHINSTQS